MTLCWPQALDRPQTGWNQKIEILDTGPCYPTTNQSEEGLWAYHTACDLTSLTLSLKALTWMPWGVEVCSTKPSHLVFLLDPCIKTFTAPALSFVFVWPHCELSTWIWIWQHKEACLHPSLLRHFGKNLIQLHWLVFITHPRAFTRLQMQILISLWY